MDFSLEKKIQNNINRNINIYLQNYQYNRINSEYIPPECKLE